MPYDLHPQPHSHLALARGASLAGRLLLTLALASISAAQAAGNHAGNHPHAHGSGHGTPGAASIGEPGQAAQVSRTIAVSLSDNMRFTPDTIQVKRGETIRFALKNDGQLRHEFSLGTEKELLEHYEVMKKFPDMVHDEPNKATLDPGQQAEIIWRFTQAGTVHFACLHPGHYEAGMKGQVKVRRP